MKNLFILVVAVLTTLSCGRGRVQFETDSFITKLSSSGNFTSFVDKRTGVDYFARGQNAPLMSVRVNSKLEGPSKINIDNNIITLFYKKSNVEAIIEVVERSSHMVFELVDINPKANIELILWGPYPTTIGETVGECVGVVRDKNFAIGIQALNPKTIGGYPTKEDDVMPSYNIFEGRSDYSDVGGDKMHQELYRGDVAKAMGFGSVLQAYCRNRNNDRVIENWKHEKYLAPAYDDEGIIGSGIAIFGVSADDALSTIGEIELAEGLPHPVINGEWGKVSKDATASYLIIRFGEKDIQSAIDLTKQAGLKYLYHGGPFANWGNFDLKKDAFPENWKSMKRCVDIAEKQGVSLGVHTLSNFITTDDPYVTPVPHTGLAEVGTSVLVKDIDEKQVEIEIESPDFFNQMENNSLKTVRIGNELIRYNRVSEQYPWILSECQRGAFGTKAVVHSANAKIGKLMDHPYKTFLADIDLQKEMSTTLAKLFNQTGLKQISFDGLEGCGASGMGQYANILFVKNWYDSLIPKLKGSIIDASRAGHYFWHIFSRMNWGEPWYAGFRESQTQYRLKNQNFYSRNMIPRMLGWFSMKPGTSIEDAEWLLARAAGFDAGFALVTSAAIVNRNGNGEKILGAIKQWEAARHAEVFPDELKREMQDVNNEFHLEAVGEKMWRVCPVYVSRFEHAKKIRQPGEPVFSKFDFRNKGVKGQLEFIMQAVGSPVSGISIELDNHRKVMIPVRLQENQYLVYRGGEKMTLYTPEWQEVDELKVNFKEFICEPGEHNLTVDCKFEASGDEKQTLKIELRIKGEYQSLN